jgi:hypothetical protein
MPAPVWMKPALVGAGCGAVALAIIGFTVGGWVTGSKADKLASMRASAEVISAQVPYCIARSGADPASATIVPQLRAASTYNRADLVMEAGWATIPGETRPDRQVALECAKMLVAAS